MFGLLKQRLELRVAAMFRGTLAPRFEELSLPGDISVKSLPATNMLWAAELKHRKWGVCTVFAARKPMPPPAGAVEHDVALTANERREISQTGTALLLQMTPPADNMLRERKNLLRFAKAVLGHDGLGAYDMLSWKTWSRAALEVELSHDADLDVDALFCLHYVGDDENSGAWLHTHGLGETGAYDFDILNPAQGLLSGFRYDLLRGMAFALLEGSAKPGAARFPLARPGGEVSLIDATQFMRTAEERWRNLRHDPEAVHVERRVILCEPRGKLRFLRRTKFRPSRFLSDAMADGFVINFSESATAVMAERARAMFPLFSQLAEEFLPKELPVLVKLGYETDSPAGGALEHLWFRVHAVDDRSIDATLLNQPFDIARMHEGMRGTHDVARLTDWQILTPAGPINPWSLKAIRELRENPDLDW